MELKITRHADGGVTTLALTGSIDLVTRQTLFDAGMSAIREGHAITLDMGEVDFIDSTGIGTLVELKLAARSAGVEATIGRRSARVDRILELTGLTQEWAPA